MTTAPSFERSLEQWLLAEAPTHAPTEILVTAIERVAERGQDRYLTQRLFGDWFGSSRTLRFIALTAVTALLAVALVFSAAIIGGRPAQPVPPPPVATPTPAAPRTGTPVVTPLGTPAAPVAGAFVPGPELLVGRGSHTTTQLLDGRVLVVGGQIHPDAMVPLVDSAEIWNPNEGEDSGFVRTDPPVDGRSMHTATLLPDGRVLVVGGYWWDEVNGQLALSSAEVWDPRTETFSAGGEMAHARYGHTATLLPDGRVLIAGWYDTTGSDQDSSLEIWDPATSSFSSPGNLTKPRAGHTAFVLPDGRVMFVGSDTEFWDPLTGETAAGPELVEPRYFHAVTLLSDGRVLVTGGVWGSNEDIVQRTSAEIWDPTTNEFRLIDSVETPRAGHTATLLADGRVLISGGDEPSTFEIWDSATEAFTSSGPMIENRQAGATATLLDDGSVLILGNMSRFGITRSTEIWDESAEPLPPRPPTPEPDFTPTPPPVRTGG